VYGAGLGLRRAHLGPLLDQHPDELDFMELAPENWIGVGGRLAAALDTIAARGPLAAHGLSLNLGGPDPIDIAFVRRVGQFLDRYDICHYGDHLTYCADGGHLYELLPIPYTEEAAHYLAARIRQVQDLLGRQIAVENASYYCAPGQEISELDFIRTVLEEADCLMLLDINNIYVNSVNHAYDPVAFVRELPAERIAYAHIAGHTGAAPELIIDTHGTPVIDPVWDLLDAAYAIHGVLPTMLERDENIPSLATCIDEVQRIRAIQAAHDREPGAAVAVGAGGAWAGPELV
jgi:uncharacterized protein (UPF0276 family)